MLRVGLASEGEFRAGFLNWQRGDQLMSSVSYRAAMQSPGDERLELAFTRGGSDGRQDVQQIVRLVHTVPNFGGKRWWMICPYLGKRVGKLYLPPNGDRYACREAWRIAYQSQRDASRDRPFERIHKLQRKLGNLQSHDLCLRRPKGMWHRTFERHFERYRLLEAECAAELGRMIERSRVIQKRRE
jgi:hypothetical protein